MRTVAFLRVQCGIRILSSYERTTVLGTVPQVEGTQVLREYDCSTLQLTVCGSALPHGAMGGGHIDHTVSRSPQGLQLYTDDRMVAADEGSLPLA